jgi:hypothetical protein
MKKDHTMDLATRLYNDDVYDGYEIIYLYSATAHWVAFIDLNDRALAVSLHVQHSPQGGILGDWLASPLSAHARAMCQQPS